MKKDLNKERDIKEKDAVERGKQVVTVEMEKKINKIT